MYKQSNFDNNLNCSQSNFEDLKNLKCAHPEHQNPIQLVILDSNLKQNQRLLCQSCIKDFESNQKTIGFEKAFTLTYENYQKKKELREIVLNENIKQLEQLKSNFISIKTFVNQIIEEMMQTTQFWMKDLNQIKSLQYQFYDEIDQLINLKQKIEIDQIVHETKTLNNTWISKLNKNLEWFSKFPNYSDCVNILKNLSQGKVENQQSINYLGQQCQQSQQTLESDFRRGINQYGVVDLKQEQINNQPQQQGKQYQQQPQQQINKSSQQSETQYQKTNNQPQQQPQQQQQTQKQSQKQEQALIQYYIYQDLQNLTNLIKSRKAVLEYFQNDVNHPMVILSNNKILLQLGLSSGIHFDQQQQYSKDKTLTHFLINEMRNAYKILKQVIDNDDNQSNTADPLYQSLQKYKQTYEKQQFGLNQQYKLQTTNLNNKFDQKVLSKIISSIQTVDFDVNQIKDSYPVPNVNEILQKANDYQTKTKQKLIENFERDGKKQFC